MEKENEDIENNDKDKDKEDNKKDSPIDNSNNKEDDYLQYAQSNPSESSNTNENQSIMVAVKLLLGQFLALLCVANAQFSKQVQPDQSLAFPCLLNSGYYLFFCLFWLIFLRNITMPKPYYFAIILFDTQANFLKVYSYCACQFNYPFIMNSTSVFFTCCFSFFFIKKYKYSYLHIIGVLIAFIGIGLTLYGSIINEESFIDQVLKNYVGMLCSLGSACFYSISLVIMERFFTSGKDIYEFFPWMGFCGTLLSFAESFILHEYDNVMAGAFSWLTGFWFACFILTMVTFNTISPFFIKRHSASMFNISLVSQIFWSYIVEIIFEFVVRKSVLYYVGFGVIVLGLFVFSLRKVDRKEVKEIIIKDELRDELIPPTSRSEDYTNNHVNLSGVYDVGTERKMAVYNRRMCNA